MNSLSIKKGDNVLVITGKDKGKTGEVVACDPKSHKVLVKNINVQKKNVKAKSAQQPGGIVTQEGPIDVSNVMVICPKCGKATRTSVGTNKDEKKIRLCKKCGAEIVYSSDQVESKKSSKRRNKKAEDKN